jgi:hypothetical protein
MTPEASDMQAVLERLEKLERQNRRLKRGGIIVVLLALGWVVMSQARRSRTIEAQEFDLKDAQGRLRASLAVNGDFTDLSLFSENAEEAARLTGSEHGAELHLWGPGHAFATLDVADSAGSGLHLHHANSWAGVLAAQDSADLTLSTPEAQDSKSVIGVSRQAYRVGADASFTTLGVDQDGPYVDLKDQKGFEAQLGNVHLESPHTGLSLQTSAAAVRLFGKDGKVIWRAP